MNTWGFMSLLLPQVFCQMHANTLWENGQHLNINSQTFQITTQLTQWSWYSHFFMSFWGLFTVNIEFHCIQKLPHLKFNTFKDVWLTLAHLTSQEFEPGMSLQDTDGFILLESHSQGKLIWFSIIWLLWPCSTQWTIISYPVEDIFKGVTEWRKLGQFHDHVDYTKNKERKLNAECFIFKYAFSTLWVVVHLNPSILMTIVQNKVTLFVFEKDQWSQHNKI